MCRAFRDAVLRLVRGFATADVDGEFDFEEFMRFVPVDVCGYFYV